MPRNWNDYRNRRGFRGGYREDPRYMRDDNMIDYLDFSRNHYNNQPHEWSRDDERHGFGPGDMSHTGDYGPMGMIDPHRDLRMNRRYDPSHHINDTWANRYPYSTGGSDYNVGYGFSGQRQSWGPMNFSRRGENNYDEMGGVDFRGRGPKNYQRSDERIRDEVCDLLERDPQVDASDIEVDVKDGLVTLRGSIHDRWAKRHVEDFIQDCSGVKDVRNELRIDQSFWQRAKEAILGESTSQKNPRH
jgi:osmotically-inducible protein OsmY